MACGPGKLGHKLVPDGPFASACRQHDLDYAEGKLSRLEADQRFLANMKARAAGLSSWWARIFWGRMARVYYWAVRAFGASRYGD